MTNSTRQVGEAVLFVSATCEGESCMCGRPAVRKIGEEIPGDDPLPHRHNLTAYVCAEHYAGLLGPLAARSVGVEWKQPAPASDLEQVIRERDGLRESGEEMADLLALATSPDRFGEAGTGDVYLRMVAAERRFRTFLASLAPSNE